MPLEFQTTDCASQTAGATNAYSQVNRQADENVLQSPREELERECQVLSALALQRRQTYLHWQWGLAAFTLSFCAIFGAIMMYLPGRAYEGIVSCTLFVLLTAGLAAFGGYARKTRNGRRVHTLLHRAIAADDAATTGALIDVLSLDDTRAAHLARVQLTRLAPRWTEADLAALTPDQRDGVRRIVDGTPTRRHGDAAGTAVEGREKRTGSLDLRIAVCKALARLGNGEDLAPLKRVIGLPAATAHARQIKRAAKSALGDLEARLDELGRPHTLLRASDAPVTAADELVRAATSPSGTPVDELLRPE